MSRCLACDGTGNRNDGLGPGDCRVCGGQGVIYVGPCVVIWLDCAYGPFPSKSAAREYIKSEDITATIMPIKAP